MIVIDRTKCVSCGACSTMTLTFTCLQNTGDYELYAEPPKQDRDYVQEMVWQHEHFPELDRLYEEGKTEELLELLHRYGAEGHDMWDWPHYEEMMEKEDGHPLFQKV